MPKKVHEAAYDLMNNKINVGDVIAVAFEGPRLRVGTVLAFSPFKGNKAWLGIDVEWRPDIWTPTRNTQIRADEHRISIVG